MQCRWRALSLVPQCSGAGSNPILWGFPGYPQGHSNKQAVTSKKEDTRKCQDLSPWLSWNLVYEVRGDNCMLQPSFLLWSWIKHILLRFLTDKYMSMCLPKGSFSLSYPRSCISALLCHSSSLAPSFSWKLVWFCLFFNRVSFQAGK